MLKANTIGALLAWILGGALVIVVGLSVFHVSYCKPIPKEWPPNTQQHSTNQTASAQKAHQNALGSEAQQREANDKQRDTDQNTENTAWYCDYKISDIGIVFLTYCLVVVGALAIRSAEQVTEAMDRPRFFVTEIDPTAILREHPLLIVDIANHGRVAGRVLSVSGGVSTAAGGKEIDPDSIELVEIPLHEVRQTIPPEKEYTAPLQLADYKSPNTIGHIKCGELKYVVRMVFKYTGFKSATHKTAICVFYDAEAKRFRRIGGNKHNYTT